MNSLSSLISKRKLFIIQVNTSWFFFFKNTIFSCRLQVFFSRTIVFPVAFEFFLQKHNFFLSPYKFVFKNTIFSCHLQVLFSETQFSPVTFNIYQHCFILHNKCIIIRQLLYKIISQFSTPFKTVLIYCLYVHNTMKITV